MFKTAVLVAGALGSAWLLGSNIREVMVADRSVQVRGAAELPVVADLATWTLGVSASGDNLPAAQQDFSKQLQAVRAFLLGKGLTEAELDSQNITVADSAANAYSQSTGPRFTLSGGVVVRTPNLAALDTAKKDLPQLVGQGVVLTSSWGPQYSFSKLNEMKPQLISQATAAARASAEQFAKDSGTSLGPIRKARQGSVEILGRDAYAGEAEQPHKILRVVTTVDYTLN